MSAQMFLEVLFGEHFWPFGKKTRQELKARLKGSVPIFGYISHSRDKKRGEGRDFCVFSQFISIYLADKKGNIIKEMERDCHDQKKKLSSVTGVDWDYIHCLTGSFQANPDPDGVIDSCGWSIFFISEFHFRWIEKKGIAVIADLELMDLGSLPQEARRVVFPCSINVNLDLPNPETNNLMLQFVKFHKYCIEYLTKEGRKVFDHRKNRKRILQQFIDLIPDLSRAEKVQARRILSAIASGKTSNDENQFGYALIRVTGSELISAEKILDPSCSITARFLAKSMKWESYHWFFFHDNIQDLVHLVIRDSE